MHQMIEASGNSADLVLVNPWHAEKLESIRKAVRLIRSHPRKREQECLPFNLSKNPPGSVSPVNPAKRVTDTNSHFSIEGKDELMRKTQLLVASNAFHTSSDEVSEDDDENCDERQGEADANDHSRSLEEGYKGGPPALSRSVSQHRRSPNAEVVLSIIRSRRTNPSVRNNAKAPKPEIIPNKYLSDDMKQSAEHSTPDTEDITSSMHTRSAGFEKMKERIASSRSKETYASETSTGSSSNIEKERKSPGLSRLHVYQSLGRAGKSLFAKKLRVVPKTSSILRRASSSSPVPEKPLSIKIPRRPVSSSPVRRLAQLHRTVLPLVEGSDRKAAAVPKSFGISSIANPVDQSRDFDFKRSYKSSKNLSSESITAFGDSSGGFSQSLSKAASPGGDLTEPVERPVEGHHTTNGNMLCRDKIEDMRSSARENEVSPPPSILDPVFLESSGKSQCLNHCSSSDVAISRSDSTQKIPTTSNNEVEMTISPVPSVQDSKFVKETTMSRSSEDDGIPSSRIPSKDTSSSQSSEKSRASTLLVQSHVSSQSITPAESVHNIALPHNKDPIPVINGTVSSQSKERMRKSLVSAEYDFAATSKNSLVQCNDTRIDASAKIQDSNTSLAVAVSCSSDVSVEMRDDINTGPTYSERNVGPAELADPYSRGLVERCISSESTSKGTFTSGEDNGSVVSFADSSTFDSLESMDHNKFGACSIPFAMQFFENTCSWMERGDSKHQEKSSSSHIKKTVDRRKAEASKQKKEKFHNRRKNHERVEKYNRGSSLLENSSRYDLEEESSKAGESLPKLPREKASPRNSTKSIKSPRSPKGPTGQSGIRSKKKVGFETRSSDSQSVLTPKYSNTSKSKKGAVKPSLKHPTFDEKCASPKQFKEQKSRDQKESDHCLSPAQGQGQSQVEIAQRTSPDIGTDEFVPSIAYQKTQYLQTNIDHQRSVTPETLEHVFIGREEILRVNANVKYLSGKESSGHGYSPVDPIFVCTPKKKKGINTIDAPAVDPILGNRSISCDSANSTISVAQEFPSFCRSSSSGLGGPEDAIRQRSPPLPDDKSAPADDKSAESSLGALSEEQRVAALRLAERLRQRAATLKRHRKLRSANA